MILPDIGENKADLTRRHNDLKRMIVEARSARRGESMSIGEGGLRLYDSGGLTIDDGGQIHMTGGGSFQGDDGGNFVLMHAGNEARAFTAGTFIDGAGTQYGVGVFTRNGEVLFNASQFGDNKYVVLGAATDYLTSISAHAEYVLFQTTGVVGEISLASSGGVVSMPGLVSSAVAGVPVHINATTGRLYQFTSSARFKQDIEDAPDLSDAVLHLRPRRFRHRDDVAADPGAPAATGFIAEEVADAGLDAAVVTNSDGQAEGLRETAIITGLVQLAQRQQTQLDAQQQQINDLARRLAALEGAAT